MAFENRLADKLREAEAELKEASAAVAFRQQRVQFLREMIEDVQQP